MDQTGRPGDAEELEVARSRTTAAVSSKDGKYLLQSPDPSLDSTSTQVCACVLPVNKYLLLHLPQQLVAAHAISFLSVQ